MVEEPPANGQRRKAKAGGNPVLSRNCNLVARGPGSQVDRLYRRSDHLVEGEESLPAPSLSKIPSTCSPCPDPNAGSSSVLG